MHIKRLILENFKSYKERTVLDFVPGHNAIVGKNGSGKSNIFFAIRFVLSQKYQTVRAEDRKALLHEGSGRTEVLSASVEVVFCNKDGRMPVDKEEVCLKRTIGMKKDEFFLNKKHVTKQDVESLLESAGFSRSNPYNIVAQGRVTTIIKMTEYKRLNLFKELAGTSVYDERRKESLKIMKDTESRSKDIQKVIQYIDTRLEELKSETKELEAYQREDAKKQALEYCMYTLQKETAEKKLSKLKETEEDSQLLDEVFELREHLKEEIDKDTNKQAHAQENRDKAKMQKEAFDKRLVELKRDLKEAEIRFEQLSTSTKSDKSEKKRIEKEVARLAKEIKVQEDQLRPAIEDWKEKLNDEEELSRKLQRLEGDRDAIYAKQSRGQQYSSKSSRNKHLDEEVKKLKKEKHQLEQAVDNLQREMKTTKAQREKAYKDMERADQEINNCKATIQKLDSTSKDHNAKKSEITNAKKTASRDLKEAERKYADREKQLQDVKQELRRTMSGSMWGAYANCSKLVKRLGLTGVYGTVMDLITCKKPYYTCVEVTAGNRLLHWVVDTPATAATIIKNMQKDKLGRVTLLPLSKIRIRNRNFPQSKDAFPMIKQLQYPEETKPIMDMIFGDTLICRSLDFCSDFSKDYNMDAITLEGDQVTRRGAMKGGYQDTRKQRLEKCFRQRECKEDMKKIKSELDKAQKVQEAKTRELLQFEGQGQNIFTKRASARAQLKEWMDRRKDAKERFQSADRTYKQQETSLRKMQQSSRLDERIHALQQEKLADLSTALTAEESQHLEDLMTKIADTSRNLGEKRKTRLEAETQKDLIETKLNVHLKKQHEDMTNQLLELQSSNTTDRLEQAEVGLKEAENRMKEHESKMDEVDREYEDAVEQASVAEAQLAKNREELAKADVRWEGLSKETENRKSNQHSLREKISDANDRIRSLGALPSTEIIDKFRDLSKKELHKSISKVNGKLKKFNNVNKKAIDEFRNFTEQKQTLHNRKVAQEKGKRAITKLIKHLDMKKKEAIDRTFHHVQREFVKVFKEIVPGGRAELRLILKDAEDEEEDDVKQNDDDKTEKYKGVQMLVSFNEKADNVKQNTLLSGGQQTCVALALILAIQRADPSPFYLFDEIDAALDQRYRSNIAGVIKSQSGDTQFICTTFRPEQLAIAHRFFGVQYRNKVSYTTMVTKDQAEEFLEDAM